MTNQPLTLPTITMKHVVDERGHRWWHFTSSDGGGTRAMPWRSAVDHVRQIVKCTPINAADIVDMAATPGVADVELIQG